MKFTKMTSGLGAVAMAGILAFSAPAIASDSALDAKEINKIIKSYILDNPEVLIESLESFEVRQRDEQMKKAQMAVKDRKEDLFADEHSPSIGPEDADITIVEFFDYNCGYCKKALNDLSTVLKDDDNIRVVFKEFPVLSPESHEAAKWSLASNMQGKYFDFHQALMMHRGQKNKDAFKKIADDLGLDFEKLEKDSQSARVKSTLDEMRDLAGALGVRGTPGFVINDQLYPGWIPADRMKDEIAKKRQAAKK